MRSGRTERDDMEDREEPCSVDVEGVVGSESAPVDGVLVVGLALVEAGVLLRGRIDLHFGLDAVLAHSVLVHLHGHRNSALFLS